MKKFRARLLDKFQQEAEMQKAEDADEGKSGKKMILKILKYSLNFDYYM